MQFITVVIPVLNSAQFLEKCLTSLILQEYPKDLYEIVIVDSGSIDNSLKIANKYSCKIVLAPKSCTIAYSRNLGAADARGDIIAFIDSDCVAPINWLLLAAEIINQQGVVAVGAEYNLPDNSFWLERVWYSNTQCRKINGEISWLPSCNLIVLKDVFFKVKGFTENLETSEDVDFCSKIRMQRLGKIISSPALSVVHLGNPKSLLDFFNKEKWRGRGVLQGFVRALPHSRVSKAFLFGLFSIFLGGIIVLGFYRGISLGDWALFWLGCGIYAIPSCYLSIRSITATGNYSHFFPLILLYMIYGLARSWCFIDIRNWILKKK